jgi:hypothetical protein
MRFVGANDHPHPDSPEDPRYYAPRSARDMADPRSHVTPQTSSGHLPPDPASSRFDEMREEAFAKFTRPLESQLAYDRRPARGLLAGAIAVVSVIAGLATATLTLLPAVDRVRAEDE